MENHIRAIPFENRRDNRKYSQSGLLVSRDLGGQKSATTRSPFSRLERNRIANCNNSHNTLRETMETSKWMKYRKFSNRDAVDG